MLLSGIETAARRARLDALVPVLEDVAAMQVPRLAGRARGLEAARTALAPALAQAREAQQLLGEVPQLRRIAERMNVGVTFAEAGAPRINPRIVARGLAADLRATSAELSPAAARVDELFSRDSSTWTRSEIEELRRIFLEAPEHERPPVFGGPFRHRKETFDMKSTLDYMATTHDATDLAISNRFAADWRLMRDPAVTRESLAARVDDIFSRDAATWTTREIHDLAAIWRAPADLRPTAIGGPYRVKNESFTIQSVLDWMTTTRDATDIAVSNRFATAWRAAGMQATPAQVAAKVDDIFRRDAATWTSRDVEELRTLLYDVPEQLRPTHGPEQLTGVNFRLGAGPKEEAGVRYSLRSILDYMATTHDATDLQVSNMYAEAWLLASREAKDEVLGSLRRHAATGEAITGPGGRVPSEVTLSILGDEFLGEAAGTERALRAASMLDFANTRLMTRRLLTEIQQSLPTSGRPELAPAYEQTHQLVNDNLARIGGSIPDGQARGMALHPRFDELGRLQSQVRLIHRVEQPPAPTAASEVVERAGRSARPAAIDALAW